MKNKKLIASVAALAVAATAALSGCGNGANETAGNYSQVNFPVSEDVTLKVWAVNTHMVVKNMKDMGCYQEITKNTGVKFDFVSPVAGQTTEQFNIMIASGEYPDIIEQFQNRYKGGFVKAWNDNVILELSDLVKKCAPNLSALYKKYPQLEHAASNAEGQMFAVPMMRGGSILRTYTGPAVRADYLKKFNISAPETIDDWHNMLTTFKSNGIEYPFTATKGYFNFPVFVGAYGVGKSFYNDNGAVKFGPIENGYKEYVKTMAQWYKEGLIDSEILTNDQKIADSKIMNGGAGAFIGTTGNSIGGYLQEMKSKNPDFDLQPVKYPVLNSGEVNRFVQRDDIVQTVNGSVITTACEHPDIAMAVLDYGFSKEGHMALNFGVEGESYTMEDGYPKYTDLIMHNPDGLNVSKAGSLYARSFTYMTGVQDSKYGEQFYGNPRQQESTKVWASSVDAINANNPTVYATLTPERTDEISSSLNEINTYVSEKFAKWMMGTEDIDAGFDEYVDQIKKMGIEKILGYYQEAQDKYFEKYPDMKHQTDIEVSDIFWQE